MSRGRDDVVLVHLNHRLSQMCLRLLRAEVWAEKGRSKLQRVTARVVPNSISDTPAVIAHARLVVIGGDNVRLHEEGLLDHTAKRATEPILGLSGTRAKEPEIPLAELEKRSP